MFLLLKLVHLARGLAKGDPIVIGVVGTIALALLCQYLYRKVTAPGPETFEIVPATATATPGDIEEPS